MTKKMLVQTVLCVAVTLAGLIVASVAFGPMRSNALSTTTTAEVREDRRPNAQVDLAGLCSIREVGAYDNRIHVKCYDGFGPGNAITFFAAPTSDVARSNRLLSIMLTAHAAGKRLNIGYGPVDGSFGCLPSDCRPIADVFMVD